MTSALTIAATGIQAAQTRLDASAHNVANLATEGFRRELVQQADQPQGGVSATIRRAAAPGANLEADMVEQLQAKNAALANLAVFRTSARVTGALLDSKA